MRKLVEIIKLKKKIVHVLECITKLKSVNHWNV